mmetsp:Transcript_27972/g.53237  ORF Transcript_27972/g.53237 Transcript_27972/m.53237 type:complete len:149 (-) Transcript_27972:205-651(-)|eukprot:CAMPEP_0114256614 /NCGR_PEP_ID=MMETSP0058-20121206/18263_1 /TAXON_ID=36894 /ORGANISM="Pyramimonas parkeae, CCMP726" /LENGTH=148 /DNA_ID=CAMNT_0001371225 /DNA_START=70 /DNA_END=516 /DNA_ORIENTATION=+
MRAISLTARLLRYVQKMDALPPVNRIHTGFVDYGLFTRPVVAGPALPFFSQRFGFAAIADVQNEVDKINEKFAEARDEIECAMEDAETVYFNESAQTAKEVAGECIGLWTKLLEQSDNDTRAALTRSMGLKIEQLKAELKLLDHAHDD